MDIRTCSLKGKKNNQNCKIIEQAVLAEYLPTIAVLTINQCIANNVNRNQNTKLEKGKLHTLTPRKTIHTHTAQASGLVIIFMGLLMVKHATFYLHFSRQIKVSLAHA